MDHEDFDDELNSGANELVISGNHLPAIVPSKDLTVIKPDRVTEQLNHYIREINRYPLLSEEQEKALTSALFETGDIEIAKKLVMANLRLVVKIAMEYRSTYENVMDLIQEGNIGLMKAVSKYDPTKGAKLSYYASWWIKSYILKYILDNFRLVKIGSSNDQKKLFYNLIKEKERLTALGIVPDSKQLSASLGVSEKAVIVMDQRLGPAGGEVSLDQTLRSDESGSSTLGDLIADEREGVEAEVERMQGLDILNSHLKDFVMSLKPRDREIFQKRLLSEVQPSLQAIADEYGVSRERIRQIEERLLEKLKVYMSEFIR